VVVAIASWRASQQRTVGTNPDNVRRVLRNGRASEVYECDGSNGDLSGGTETERTTDAGAGRALARWRDLPPNRIRAGSRSTVTQVYADQANIVISGNATSGDTRASQAESKSASPKERSGLARAVGEPSNSTLNEAGYC